MIEILDDKRKKRWLMLQKFYELLNGESNTATILIWEVGEMLGWNRETTESTYNYLVGEGLLRTMTLGGEATITHQGVREVEEAEEYPNKPTNHFPPFIMNITSNNVEGDINSVSQAEIVGGHAHSIRNNTINARQIDSLHTGSGSIINYHTISSQPLDEAAAEIQKLLEQLEQTNPTATESDQIQYVNIATRPELKTRVKVALQAGGEKAFEEFILDNKYLKVVKEIIKGWCIGKT